MLSVKKIEYSWAINLHVCLWLLIFNKIARTRFNDNLPYIISTKYIIVVVLKWGQHLFHQLLNIVLQCNDSYISCSWPNISLRGWSPSIQVCLISNICVWESCIPYNNFVLWKSFDFEQSNKFVFLELSQLVAQFLLSIWGLIIITMFCFFA